MSKPFLLTLEYPPQYGGVAKYLEGEVKASPVPVVVIRAQDLMWRLWPKWLPLLWRVNAPAFTKEGVGGWLWISHVLPIGYIALVWKCFFKTPYRVYLHGLDLIRPRRSTWKSFWVKIILNNANEIITNSQATAQLLNYYGIDANRARVQYPRIGAPTCTQEGVGGRLRAQYNLENKPILLTISRLVKRKGIDLVIKSMPAVWKDIPDLVYVVVGEGEEREYLEDIKKTVIPSLSRNLVDNRRDPSTPLRSAQDDVVIFTGPVSDEAKYGWLAACDCFILTPIDDPNDFEGYGIVYKEAQMFGKPVIGSRVGGVPEAIGDEGVLVEAGNIEQIINSVVRCIKKQGPQSEPYSNP